MGLHSTYPWGSGNDSGHVKLLGKSSGLMVSVMDSRLSRLSSSPGRGHCVVFLGKILKGARSRYFRQFQHWSARHQINRNIKITT